MPSRNPRKGFVPNAASKAFTSPHYTLVHSLSPRPEIRVPVYSRSSGKPRTIMFAPGTFTPGKAGDEGKEENSGSQSAQPRSKEDKVMKDVLKRLFNLGGDESGPESTAAESEISYQPTPGEEGPAQHTAALSAELAAENDEEAFGRDGSDPEEEIVRYAAASSGSGSGSTTLLGERQIHYRCDILTTNGYEFRNTELECKAMVMACGSEILDTHEYPGGFLYKHLPTTGNPLTSGGDIAIIPYTPLPELKPDGLRMNPVGWMERTSLGVSFSRGGPVRSASSGRVSRFTERL